MCTVMPAFLVEMGTKEREFPKSSGAVRSDKRACLHEVKGERSRDNA